MFVSADQCTYNPCKKNYLDYLVCPVWGVVVVAWCGLLFQVLSGLSLVVLVFSLFLDLALDLCELSLNAVTDFRCLSLG